MTDDRKLGPNMRRLLAVTVAMEALPGGSGLPVAIALINEPARLIEVSRRALTQIDEAITAVRSANDNPYGEDEETIAAVILEELDKKRKSMRYA